MRDPNINIRLSDLAKVFSKMGLNEKQLIRFTEECSKFSCSDRVAINTKASTKKKITRVLKADVNDTLLFKEFLLADRAENHNIKFVKFIVEGSRDYTNLKEAAIIAVEYAESYGMDKRDGMQEFIKVGIKLMRRKFGLNRFKSLAGKIFEAKRVHGLMQGEGLKKGVQVASVYFKELEKETRSKYDAKIPDETFVNFIYAYEEIEAAKATIKDWIVAQFAGLAFMDILPEINQLHGDGAAQRYVKYKFGKLVKMGGKNETQIDLSMMDKGQRDHFKKML